MREAARSVLVVGLIGSTLVAGNEEQIVAAQTRNASSALHGPPAHPPDSVESAVSGAYAREFGETVRRPAIYNDPSGDGCSEPRLTTTAYLPASPTSGRLLYLSTSPDGLVVTQRSKVESVVLPAGTFRVLVVIARHPATVDDSSLQNWESAQATINHDHAAFAASRGLKQPIVAFDNTNVLVDVGDIADPRSPASVRAAVERSGLPTAPYRFVVSVNLDPTRAEGGFAGAGGFVYMGNYGRWSYSLSAAEWVNVANAVYHHEVAHHWGWPGSHDWARQCRGQAVYLPFIVPPILFGWEDVDGDGIPEILDATPYGRLR
jgi:hypothetical protein